MGKQGEKGKSRAPINSPVGQATGTRSPEGCEQRVTVSNTQEDSLVASEVEGRKARLVAVNGLLGDVRG